VKRCIMVGDPKQLPATVLSTSPRVVQGLGRSLFERLQQAKRSRVFLLGTQYRMHPAIARFPSAHFYGGRLRNGAAVRAPEYWQPYHFDRRSRFGPLSFLDTAGCAAAAEDRSGGGSVANAGEARIVCALLEALFRQYPDELCGAGKVAVLTPYKRQVAVVRRELGASRVLLGADVEVSTIDGIQGREKQLVVLSTVRGGSSSLSGIGFVKDERRMNVALTRARLSLIVVGNAASLAQGSRHWASLVRHCELTNSIQQVKSPRELFPEAFVVPSGRMPKPARLPAPADLPALSDGEDGSGPGAMDSADGRDGEGEGEGESGSGSGSGSGSESESASDGEGQGEVKGEGGLERRPAAGLAARVSDPAGVGRRDSIGTRIRKQVEASPVALGRRPAVSLTAAAGGAPAGARTTRSLVPPVARGAKPGALRVHPPPLRRSTVRAVPRSDLSSSTPPPPPPPSPPPPSADDRVPEKALPPAAETARARAGTSCIGASSGKRPLSRRPTTGTARAPPPKRVRMAATAGSVSKDADRLRAIRGASKAAARPPTQPATATHGAITEPVAVRRPLPVRPPVPYAAYAAAASACQGRQVSEVTRTAPSSTAAAPPKPAAFSLLAMSQALDKTGDARRRATLAKEQSAKK
jgi:hypothetical protein